MYGIVFASVGAGILLGALLGSARSCETGACPLTATPQRGAIWGGLLGLLVAMIWAGSQPAVPAPRPTASAPAATQPARIVDVATQAEFDRQVREAPKTVVVFHAAWCGACRTYEPTLETVAAETPRSVAFLRVDTDRLRALARTYGVEYLPTTVVLENGKVKSTLVGAVSGAELRRAIGPASTTQTGPSTRASEP